VRTGILVLVLTVAATVPAAAQTAAGTAVGSASAGSGYETAGRRDPFMTLVAPRRPAPRSVPAPPLRPRAGLAALALADVSVRGVLRAGDVMMAILEGPDKKSFNAKVDDKLADASIKAIDAQGVVFVVRPDGASPVEVRKALRSAAEVIR